MREALKTFNKVGESIKSKWSDYAFKRQYPEPVKAVISAASSGNVELMKKLLEAGYLINVRDEVAGNSALFYGMKLEETHSKMITFLLEQTIQPIDLNIINDMHGDKETALHSAVGKCHRALIHILLSAGADYRIENAKGQNALAYIRDLKDDEFYHWMQDLIQRMQPFWQVKTALEQAAAEFQANPTSERIAKTLMEQHRTLARYYFTFANELTTVDPDIFHVAIKKQQTTEFIAYYQRCALKHYKAASCNYQALFQQTANVEYANAHLRLINDSVMPFLNQFNQPNKAEELSYFYTQLAHVYLAVNNFKAATESAHQALNISSKLYGQLETNYKNFLTLATAAAALNENDNAINYYQQAIAHGKSLGYTQHLPQELPNAYLNLGKLLSTHQRTNEAVHCYQEALATCKKIYSQAPAKEIEIFIALAASYAELTEYEKAISYYKQASQLKAQFLTSSRGYLPLTDATEENIELQLAQLYSKMGDNEKANLYFEKAKRQTQTALGEIKLPPVMQMQKEEAAEEYEADSKKFV